MVARLGVLLLLHSHQRVNISEGRSRGKGGTRNISGLDHFQFLSLGVQLNVLTAINLFFTC